MRGKYSTLWIFHKGLGPFNRPVTPIRLLLVLSRSISVAAEEAKQPLGIAFQ
jgi:hypothetical protein